MTCLALCYYNVEAAKGRGYSKGKQAARQVTKKEKEKATQAWKEENEEMIQIGDNRIDDESRANYKKGAEKWVLTRTGKKSSVQDDENEETSIDDEVDQDDLPPSYEDVIKEKINNGEITGDKDKSKDAGTQTEDESDDQTEDRESEDELKNKIDAIIGNLKDKKAEKAAIAKVSEILNIPEEFLGVPRTLFKDKNKKMDSVHFIAPYTKMIISKERWVVFQGYENKLSESKLLPVYKVSSNVDTSGIKEWITNLCDKAKEIMDKVRKDNKGKVSKAEFYYTDMPTKEEILSRIEGISDSTEEDED